jgi:folate-binding protein YgfZ
MALGKKQLLQIGAKPTFLGWPSMKKRRTPMTALSYAALPHRKLIQVGGEDPQTFLQGLVSADVMKATGHDAVYGAFLTPQGRFLHEFFLAEGPDGLLLETDADGRDAFIQRLSRYNLRRKVTVTPVDAWTPYALMGEGAAAAAATLSGGRVVADPRLPAAGLRAWLGDGGAAQIEAAGFQSVDFTVWDRYRIGLGLPDGARDLVPDKTILLEAGFDELGGVDWKKGCFLGQETTARSKYRGHVRRRMLPVRIQGPAPETGATVYLGEADVGEMCSNAGSVGLAFIRIDSLTPDVELQTGATTLRPWTPEWVML